MCCPLHHHTLDVLRLGKGVLAPKDQGHTVAMMLLDG